MTALANSLERLAMADADHERVYSETLIEDYEYLLDLANDVYVASLETHLASLDCFGLSH